MFNEEIINNPYVIVGFFIITILYELFTYLTINNAKKKTRALLEKNKFIYQYFCKAKEKIILLPFN